MYAYKEVQRTAQIPKAVVGITIDKSKIMLGEIKMENTKLTTCKACGEQVAKTAKTCPHCGAKIKKGHPVAIGIAVVLILIAVAVSTGESNTPKKVDSPATTQNTVKTSVQVTEAPKNQKDAFLLGETAELNNVQVTLASVTESDGSAYNKPSDGNVFVLCEFEIANNSDKEINISSMMSFNAYCDDYACTYSLTALLEKGNKNQLDGTIAAGKKFNGVIGYEVPTDWNELEVHFTPDFWSGKDITFIATK